MSQQINLFNPVFLHQKKYFSVMAMLQGLGLILLGSVLVYAYALYQVRQLEEQSAETAKRYASEQEKLARYAAGYSPQQANLLLEQDVTKAEAQLAAQQALIASLKSSAIGNASGYSEYLRAFAREVVPGLWLTGFNIAGNGAEMSLSGATLNPALVPDYVQRLSREKIMHGKVFASLQMQQPKVEGDKQKQARYVEFTLQSVEAGEAAK